MRWVVGTAWAIALVASACGGAPAPPASTTPAATPTDAGASAEPGAMVAASTSTAADAAVASAPTAASTNAPTTPAEKLLAATRADLAACWAEGKKTNPELAAGHLIVNLMSHDGRITCAVPSESAGLATDIEQCVATRMQREPYPHSQGVEGAALAIDFSNQGEPTLLPEVPRSTAGGIESLETHGVDRAGPVVMKLMENFNQCILDGLVNDAHMHGMFYVHAKLDAAGGVACAVVNRADDTVRPETLRCAEEQMAKARFSRPKHGSGSVTVPIKVAKKK